MHVLRNVFDTRSREMSVPARRLSYEMSGLANWPALLSEGTDSECGTVWNPIFFCFLQVFCSATGESSVVGEMSDGMFQVTGKSAGRQLILNL